MSTIVHFEIYVDDMQRARTFYGDVFGWAFQDMGSAFNNYVVVYPGGEITQGPAKIGINGGMLKRPGPAPENDKAAPNAFVCTVSVDNIEEIITNAVNAGGRLDVDVTTIPGVGKMAYVRDTEMNLIGLLQPEMQR